MIHKFEPHGAPEQFPCHSSYIADCWGLGLTTYTFKIVVEPDEDRWRAYCPALEDQGAATWGYTREEALRHIREVLEMIVAELVEEGRPVPGNVAVSEEPLVAVTV